MYGREPRLPVDVVFGLDLSDDGAGKVDESAYVAKLRKQLEYSYSLVTSHQKAAGQQNKRRYDQRARGSVPGIGDRVLLRNVGLRGKHKIADRWEDEVYVVTGRPDPDLPVYSIRKENSRGRSRNVHRNLLLPLDPPQTRDKSPTPVSSSSESEEVSRVRISIPRDLFQVQESSSASSEHSEESDSSGDDESRSDSGSVSSPEVAPLRRGTRNRRPPAWLRSGEFQTFTQQCSIKSRPELLLQIYHSFLSHHKVLVDHLIAALK